MSNSHGIVLIGCGHIGAAHLDDLFMREGLKIIGVVDLNEEKAQMFAKRYGAKSWSTNYRYYLNNKEADIFIIATYASSHLEILKSCVSAGKNVLCEKPIATTMEDGLEFYRVVKNCVPKVLVGHILRHNETYQQAVQMVHSGMIGDVKVMRMTQNHHTMYWPRYKKLLQDCPPIVDCGVHYFDIMQWATGAKIVSVGGIGARVDEDAPTSTYNYGIVTVKLSNGATGFYESGWGKSIASNNTKEFIGTKGRIRIVLASSRIENREEGDVIEYYNMEDQQYHLINKQAKYKNMYSQMENLIDMIENNNNNSNPSMEDVMSSFKVAMAADRAVRDHCVYQLDPQNQEIVPE